jgi:hypothetical protein
VLLGQPSLQIALKHPINSISKTMPKPETLTRTQQKLEEARRKKEREEDEKAAQQRLAEEKAQLERQERETAKKARAVERREEEERAKEEERTKSVAKEKVEEAKRIFEETKANAVAEVTAQRVAAAAAAATKDNPTGNINELLADLNKQDDSIEVEDTSLGSDDSIPEVGRGNLGKTPEEEKTGQTRQRIRSLGRRGRLKRSQPRKQLKRRLRRRLGGSLMMAQYQFLSCPNPLARGSRLLGSSMTTSSSNRL